MDTNNNSLGVDSNPIPRPNPQVLLDSLRKGHLNVASALAQINVFIRETLKTIEDFADEQVKVNHERKHKVDKMEKIIGDLSEKCQGMQQALLFKEEKYDEKCREVERYKVICELSANAAVGDNQYCRPGGGAIGNPDEVYDGPFEQANNRQAIVKMEARQIDSSRNDANNSSVRNIKGHTKLNQSQLHLSRYVQPLRPESPRSNVSEYAHYEDFDRHSIMSQYYAADQSKRKVPINVHSTFKNDDTRVKERLETIGGINVRGSRIKSGPVTLDRLLNKPPNNAYNDDSNKRVKIDLTSQRDEVMSSSGNMAHQVKQRIVERDLHKQVADGCWTRMAGRRKKDWPF